MYVHACVLAVYHGMAVEPGGPLLETSSFLVPPALVIMFTSKGHLTAPNSPVVGTLSSVTTAEEEDIKPRLLWECSSLELQASQCVGLPSVTSRDCALL